MGGWVIVYTTLTEKEVGGVRNRFVGRFGGFGLPGAIICWILRDCLHVTLLSISGRTDSVEGMNGCSSFGS